MVRIAFDMDNVGQGVLRAVAQTVDENPAGDGAIGAGVTGLARGAQLERPHRGREGLAGEAEPERTGGRSHQAGAGEFHESAATQFHVRRSYGLWSWPNG